MSRSLVNFIIDLFGFVMMLGILATGLLVRYILPPGSGQWRTVWGCTRHDWGDVHFWMAMGLGVVVLVHVALHWGWVCSVVNRMIPGNAANRVVRSRLRQNAIGVGVLAAAALLVVAFLGAAQNAKVERDEGTEGRRFRGGRLQTSRVWAGDGMDEEKDRHEAVLNGG